LDCGGGERNRMLRDSHDWYTTSEKGLSLAQSSTRLLVSIRSSLSLNEIYIAMPRETSEGRIWCISTCPEFQITSSLFLGWLEGQIPCSSTKWKQRLLRDRGLSTSLQVNVVAVLVRHPISCPRESVPNSIKARFVPMSLASSGRRSRTPNAHFFIVFATTPVKLLAIN
jgi:hypothetical protein